MVVSCSNCSVISLTASRFNNCFTHFLPRCGGYRTETNQGETLDRLAEIATIMLCTCFPLLPRLIKLIKDRQYTSSSSGGGSKKIYSGNSMDRNNRRFFQGRKEGPCGKCTSCSDGSMCERPERHGEAADSRRIRESIGDDEQRLHWIEMSTKSIEPVEKVRSREIEDAR